jgi:hypothetical protein
MGEKQRRAEVAANITNKVVSSRGQTTIVTHPALPCGLGDCVAELHVTVRHDSMRLHLDLAARDALIESLGGTP